MRRRASVTALVASLGGLCGCDAPRSPVADSVAADTAADAATDARDPCASLVEVANLTITSARLVAAAGDTPSYCHAKGFIRPGIGYHVQLPLPSAWNGRFLQWGDGGKDGDLDFADHRLAEGYAVANSNMGHDEGSEPGASFAFDNRAAEIDFGYRAVHLTVNAAKSLIRSYYGRSADYAYFEGCSTGGRQGLMEAQRYPTDFDGIVAGAPVIFYQELNAGHTWLLQRVFQDDFAGNLAHDSNGDGGFDSLAKLETLHEAVLAKCDALDGIRDRVIDDPLACDFDPRADLAVCASGQNSAACFTEPQLSTIEDFFSGPYDSRGHSVYKGRSPGAELDWAQYMPTAANGNFPGMLRGAANGHVSYLMYENDPGVQVPVLNDPSYVPNKERHPPEHAWWEFDIDDMTAGRADFMKAITNADDPDLRRFLLDQGGKLIVWHGWADAGAPPEPTLDYYNDVVDVTFGGDLEGAREHARLLMFPGMGHCAGGAGPNEWDPLAPLVDWVERGTAPEHVVATHTTDGVVDNERKVCAFPSIARYVGPEAGRNDPASWVERNFVCE